ncbi:MAG: galactokinase [Thermococcaceae archaeon]|nr:galactokinase [Thermococcaceae archaeon]
MHRADSPGRIKLMGEETDHVLGYSISLAINLYTVVHAQMHNNVRIYSRSLREVREFDPKKPQKTGDWSDVVKAVFWALQDEGYEAGGLKAIIGGDLPLGPSLGAYTSLETAFISLLNAMYGLNMLPVEIPLFAKKAAVEYLGAPVGISEPVAICLGKRGKALFLNSDTLHYSYIDFPADAKIILFTAGIEKSISYQSYLERKKLLEESLQILGKRSSIDVTEGELRNLPSLYRRLLGFAVRENRRVLELRDALKGEDLEMAGELLTTSHWDFSRNYEAGCDELNFVVKRAIEAGAYGAKAVDAGFNGHLAILADVDNVVQIAESVLTSYIQRFNWEATYHIVEPVDGVSVKII